MIKYKRRKNIVITIALTISIYLIANFTNIYIGENVRIFHLANVGIVAAALIFGKEKGAIAAAVGVTTFALFSPYILWIPFTFTIRFIMAYVIGSISERFDGKILGDVFAVTIGVVIMIVGYFITEMIFFQNLQGAIDSLYTSMLEAIVAFLALPLAISVKKFHEGFKEDIEELDDEFSLL